MTCDNTHRLLYEYQDSPALKGLMLSLLLEYCSLQDAAAALETRLDIDLSAGVQLDLIGEIVGAPRPLTQQADDDDTFVFDDPGGDGPWNGLGLGWSGEGRGDIGGRFVGLSGLLVGAMLDSDYRTLLRARIFSNTAKGTVDNLIEFLDFVLGPIGNAVDNGVGFVDLHVGRGLSDTETAIITLLAPVAAGIRIGDIIEP